MTLQDNDQVVDVTSLMDTYFRAEIVHDYRCSCSVVGGTQKKLNIINAPQLLVIQLGRFTNQFVKIRTHVAFTREMTTVHIRDGNGHPMRYRLTGMIRHSGASIKGGHYIAYFNILEQWHVANDSYIAELSWESVRALQAYVLIYEQL